MFYLISSLIDRFRGKKSWSHLSEDRISKWILEQFGVKRPKYIDIGGNDPRKNNNTYLFYLMGGCGIVVEPNPEFKNAYSKYRPMDYFYNYGISPTEYQEYVEYYIFKKNEFNTCDLETAKNISRKLATPYKTKRIYLKPISGIIDTFRKKYGYLDFISIDTEGDDLAIIKSLDLSRNSFRPKIICAEVIKYGQHVFERDDPIEDYLTTKDYICVANTRLNKIFVDLLLNEEGYV